MTPIADQMNDKKWSEYHVCPHHIVKNVIKVVKERVQQFISNPDQIRNEKAIQQI
jgi:hypothetical protein